MGLLSLHPFSFPPIHHHLQSFPPKPNPSSSTLSPISQLSLKSSTICSGSNSRSSSSSSSSSSSRGHQSDESSFLDEDRVVEDMDGYLNTKPSWCQPWTILLTGVSAVTCSWLFLHSTIISGGVLFIISVWWYIFLYAYPKAYQDMIAERRSKVTTGFEDTFGVRKSQ